MSLSKILAACAVLLIISGCSTVYPNRNPVGESFPQVTGQSLSKDEIRLPEFISGKKTLLLLGYVQESQFDIDRWLIGLDMTKTKIDVLELPTIQGLFPKFFKTQINQGMRKGIPKELWQGVITIYEDGESIQKFTGNINQNNARVVLVNERGIVDFFYDQGFSIAALNSLRETLKK